MHDVGYVDTRILVIAILCGRRAEISPTEAVTAAAKTPPRFERHMLTSPGEWPGHESDSIRYM